VFNAFVSMVTIDEKRIQASRYFSDFGGGFFRVGISTNQVHSLKQFAERVIKQGAERGLSSPEFPAGKIDANDRSARGRQSGEHAERSSLKRAYFQHSFGAD
jgi:hypothetical protein